MFNQPAHPYTEALLRAVPKITERSDRLWSIEGQPPDLTRLPPGCAFAPRCTYAVDESLKELPRLRPTDFAGAGARRRAALPVDRHPLPSLRR